MRQLPRPERTGETAIQKIHKLNVTRSVVPVPTNLMEREKLEDNAESAHEAAEMMKVSVVYADKHVCHAWQAQWQTCQLKTHLETVSR